MLKEQHQNNTGYIEWVLAIITTEMDLDMSRAFRVFFAWKIWMLHGNDDENDQDESNSEL
jgi:hypothetical protein